MALEADLGGRVGDLGKRSLVKRSRNQLLLVLNQELKDLLVANLFVVGLQRLENGLICRFCLRCGDNLGPERDKVVHEAELLLLIVQRGRDEDFLLLSDLGFLCTDTLLLRALSGLNGCQISLCLLEHVLELVDFVALLA